MGNTQGSTGTSDEDFALLEEKVSSREIHFAYRAVILLGGCNQYTLYPGLEPRASEWMDAVNTGDNFVIMVAATQSVAPGIHGEHSPKGKFHLQVTDYQDGDFFTLYPDGTEINMGDYIEVPKIANRAMENTKAIVADRKELAACPRYLPPVYGLKQIEAKPIPID